MSERSMILANEMGHVEINWDPKNDEDMRGAIEAMMKRGVRFFIVKPIISSITRKAKLKDAKDLKESRVYIKDEDINLLFQTGVVSVTSRDGGKIETVRPAANANEVAQNHTVGVRAQAGG